MRVFRTLLVAALAVSAVGSAGAQNDELHVRVVSMKDDAESVGRLDVYTRIPLTSLTFESGPNGFVARYAVEAEVSQLDSEGRPGSVVNAPVWERSVTVAMAAQTRDVREHDMTTYSLNLSPGRYLFGITLTDLATERVWFRELAVTQRDYSRPLTISDLVILGGYDADRNSIMPRLEDYLATGDLQLYYEVYSDTFRTVTVTRELLPRVGGPRDVRPQVRRWTDTLNVVRGRLQQIAQVPASDLSVGQYTVRVTVRDLSGRMLDRAAYQAAVRWSGLEQYVRDLDSAIEQLVYIARSGELRTLRRAETPEAARQLFDAFWKRRDPTPESVRNERMEEHYYRIDYANRRFRRQVDGWQTDRGHVFVLHGHPDDVERQVYSYNNRPWEVWYYYRIGRQYMFVDRTGLGDYELVLPIWDDRTRLD